MKTRIKALICSLVNKNLHIVQHLFKEKIKMDRRQQKTKIAIHSAMTNLLKKKKFEALTVQDIIDEANIGRSTFYSHFETKEQLLEEICNEMFSHVFAQELTPKKSHDFSSRHEDITGRLAHILYHIQDHKGNIKAILDSEAEKVFVQYFSEYLEQTFADDIRHITAKVPEDFKRRFFTESFITSIKWWIETGMKLSPEEMVECYKKMINMKR